MKTRPALLTLVAACTLFVATTARAQDELPSAREIFDRYVEATGAKALEGQTMRKATGTFGLPAQGMNGTMVTYAMAPDLTYTEIELPGIGTIKSGYNGEVAWSMDPMQGPQIMEGDALVQQATLANFYAPLYREVDIEAAEVVAESEFEGEPAYEVKVTRGGQESTEYFSVESGLLLGGAMTVETPMGQIATTSQATDYAELAGVLMATRSVTTMMGMQQVVTIDEVSLEPFDAKVFELPAEISAMLEEEPAESGR